MSNRSPCFLYGWLLSFDLLLCVLDTIDLHTDSRKCEYLKSTNCQTGKVPFDIIRIIKHGYTQTVSNNVNYVPIKNKIFGKHHPVVFVKILELLPLKHVCVFTYKLVNTSTLLYECASL